MASQWHGHGKKRSKNLCHMQEKSGSTNDTENVGPTRRSNKTDRTTIHVCRSGLLWAIRSKTWKITYQTIWGNIHLFIGEGYHFEVANTLDTSSFINAMRRFVARRGMPKQMRSDDSGNFVREERELREAIGKWNQQQIHNYLLQRQIVWKFNPPTVSHHGGVWERNIRTVRKVLKSLIKEQPLDDEGLITLLCEVESIVNGRSITKVSDDPKDAEPLTPNHLLLLRAGSKVPPVHFVREDMYSNKRWRQIQYLSNVFWRRSLKEYLLSLQHRTKWHSIKPNLKVDDIVLILDENVPRSSWPLGRIVEVFTNSRDGLLRSAKVKTQSSTFVKPITKIVSLETSDDN
ncbi:uncharacterized protein LOC117120470 [Anneissia japonica]|uniref:uncharacterized protein LOC117120470 n=1 Tax=Anneissia japonica TaxID=1529436 RepID=UPI00142581F2|nr:uncharacterized protein LOC117120470 [Anneissia japonica]